MHTAGKIVEWNDQKGFGFAKTKKGGIRIFIHISDFEASPYRPVAEQDISFIISEQERGKYKGTEICFIGSKLLTAQKRVNKTPLLLVLSFIIFLTYSISNAYLPSLITIGYGLMSLFSYYLYAKDKKAAIEGDWRVSEKLLHLSALLGGWPGAIIGQVMLHHKTKKIGFMIIFYLLLSLNLAGISWFFTEQGNVFIHSLAINLHFYLSGTGVIDFIQLWIWKINYYLNK